MCVPYTGSEAWTRSMGYDIVDEWRPWTSNGQVAGYCIFFPSFNHLLLGNHGLPMEKFHIFFSDEVIKLKTLGQKA